MKHAKPKARKKRARINPYMGMPLSQIDATKQRLPSAAVKMSATERKMLADPDWIDEDEADTMLALRDLRKFGDRSTPLRDFIRKSGFHVEN